MCGMVFIFYMVAKGVADCACSKIGNFMGELKVDQAKDLIKTTILGMTLVTFVCIILGYMAKGYFM